MLFRSCRVRTSHSHHKRSRPEHSPPSAALSVTTEDGKQQTIVIAANKGSIANPMSDDDLSEKFKGQAALTISSEAATRLLEDCWNVDQLIDVAQIARKSRPE